MRLILVRHGQTASNRDGLSLGRGPAPLTELGRRQMEACAESLVGAGIDAVYCSPLARTVESAGIVGGRLGLPVREDEAFAELDVGEMEGEPLAGLRRRYPEFFHDWLSEKVGEARPPGGETLTEVQTRAWMAIERLRGAHSLDNIAVVTHNFVILTVLCRVIGIPLEGFRRLRQDLAAKTELAVEPGRPAVVRMNDTCHLGDELLEAPFWR